MKINLADRRDSFGHKSAAIVGIRPSGLRFNFLLNRPGCGCVDGLMSSCRMIKRVGIGHAASAPLVNGSAKFCAALGNLEVAKIESGWRRAGPIVAVDASTAAFGSVISPC